MIILAPRVLREVAAVRLLDIAQPILPHAQEDTALPAHAAARHRFRPDRRTGNRKVSHFGTT